MIGPNDVTGKWIRGKGTRLVWNSLRSTLRHPLNRNEHVMVLATWDINLKREVINLEIFTVTVINYDFRVSYLFRLI